MFLPLTASENGLEMGVAFGDVDLLLVVGRFEVKRRMEINL